MVFNTSFPSLIRPLPGVKKTFPGVSSKVNSFRVPTSVTNVPTSSITSTHVPPRNCSAGKHVPQQPTTKTPAKTSVPDSPKVVPFRARPVPTSTYKSSSQSTVRKINGSRVEQEQATDKVASTCPLPATVHEPTVEDVVELTCNPPAVVDESPLEDVVELTCEPSALADEPTIEDVVELTCNPPAVVDESPLEDVVELTCEPSALADEPTVKDVVELTCNPPAVVDESPLEDVVELTCDPPAVVDESFVEDVTEIAQPIHEPTSSEEANICDTDDPTVEDSSPHDSMGQTSETNTGGARPKIRPPLPLHPTGPGIPPFLPTVYVNSVFTPYVSEQWDYNCTYVPYYYNGCYAYGTFFWDSYHSVSMTQESFNEYFPQHRILEQVPPYQASSQNAYQASDVPVGDIAQATPDVAPNVPVRNRRKKKPNKAEWNACYQRRLLKRKNERAERDALKNQSEPAEAITPQVPE